MRVAEKVCVFVFVLQGVCCRDFTISLPEKIEALSGSCVIIKCTFEIQESFDKELSESAAIGVWLKDGTNVDKHQVFNSRVHSSNHFKGAITGKLHEKNCTTIFYNVSSNHTGKYFLRIESGALKYTYTVNTSTVNVIESPPKPTVKLNKDQDQEVLEGRSVSLRCSAETLCSSPPPTLTWSFTPRIPLSESSRQQELLISDLNFTATHRHHRVTFTCTITYQLQDKNKTAQDNITLHVQCVCCRDFTISLPEKIEALSGSCVIIKCTFEIQESFDKELSESAAIGVWLKDGTNVDKHQVFNSRVHSSNHFKGAITGKLHEKNCTTIFYNVSSNHTGKYFLRIESGALKYTYTVNTSTVNVIESPPKPTVKLNKDQDQEVLEGRSVSLRCSAETLCSSPPPTLTWSFTPRIPLSESSRQQELLISDLNFTATHRHHRVTFTCTITYQLQDKNKTAQDNITLHVQCVCCRDFTISLPEKIEALSGSCVIIKCTFEIQESFDKELSESAAIGVWLKDGTNVDKHQVFNSRVHSSNHFKGAITGKLHEKNCTTIFYNVSSNHTGKYFLRIESGALKYTYTVNTSTVNVIESPPKPTVKLNKDQDQEVLEGRSVSLRCSAETLCSSPPPTLTWSFTPRIPLSESSRQQELLISDLNFTATHRHHRVTFTCTITYQLQDKNKTAQDNITLHVQCVCCRDFTISLPEKIEALSGSCVIIKCTFEIQESFDKELSESAAIGVWLKDGTNANDQQVLNSRVHSSNHFKGAITGKLHEKNCTTIFYNVSSNHTGKYFLRIESGDLKYTYKDNPSTVNVIESPPKPTVKLYKDQDQEVLEGRSVSLRCSAETLCSSPPPTLTWSFTPRIPLSESSRQQELLISDLNFTATHRHHRVTFTCTITYQLQDKNKTAQDNITLHVQYAPQISTSSTYFCEVDGNPSPELEWHLSGRPVTNSSNTFISEERLNSTGLRSSITLHQSLSHTSTLQCVGSNTHGTASQLFQLNLFSQEASCK
ncbi:unnamed protein product [Leuciscus chuanchicus]